MHSGGTIASTMIPSDMNLKIRLGTAGYNNKILVSDGKFNLGKNEKVNLSVPVIKSHNTNSIEPTTITASQGLTHAPAISQKNQKPKTITQTEKKLLWYWLWQVGLQYGICLDEISIKCMGHLLM